jgi:hypothetical protein
MMPAKSKERHFIAPHLDHVMGHSFVWDVDEELYWVSKKSKPFLERAVGCKAWIVSKALLTNDEGAFFLEGSFIVSEIRKRRYPDKWKFEVFGTDEVRFDNGTPIDDEPWFQNFLEKQNQFHFGFNDLTDPEVIAAFEEIESEFLE